MKGQPVWAHTEEGQVGHREAQTWSPLIISSEFNRRARQTTRVLQSKKTKQKQWKRYAKQAPVTCYGYSRDKAILIREIRGGDSWAGYQREERASLDAGIAVPGTKTQQCSRFQGVAFRIINTQMSVVGKEKSEARSVGALCARLRKSGFFLWTEGLSKGFEGEEEDSLRRVQYFHCWWGRAELTAGLRTDAVKEIHNSTKQTQRYDDSRTVPHFRGYNSPLSCTRTSSSSRTPSYQLVMSTWRE